ncbi:S8 family peptidase [Microbacterium rhizomatis]|uniref:S8 family peptidase n=1 Tax=Microbacterium rhizomatis TaxID=1631477 RepID=UPI001FE7395C|nr:S8 family serine peptidase [Microbacterium rhizomatis]
MYRRVLAVVGAVALMIPASAAWAATPTPDPSARFESAPSRGEVYSDAEPLSVNADGTVSVVVEMSGDPVAVVEAQQGRDLSDAEKSSIKDTLADAQAPVADTITSEGGTVEATMQSAYNGIQASIPADKVDAVAAQPNVVAVHAAANHTIENATSVPFLGVPQVWQNTGYTGKNVKIGIIDTGIDYTHANFAGPGTVAAFDAAKATSTQPADPALFGPSAPRVKGGTDLVGDDYTGSNTPQPDPNPLDCEGHGSHVAGTAAGSGVAAGGASYTGPYDASTPSRSFDIGPGVAPQADLYAIRVFGCTGSTNVVVPAIDWAVANGMDVINMSLGSDFGRGDTPDAVAASNAIGAGVVVVASSGNAGTSPYITGSPASGDGVISVAAIDSTAKFPGASLAFAGNTVDAINANGADLTGIPPLTIVRLTGPNALGCSAAAFTAAGIVPGQNQVAVVDRGTCARVAKAIFGQQAGAAAVIMVNNVDSLPPFEGAITSNPDDGTPYTVTIPFLGVTSSTGPALTAAVGQSLTITPKELDNPSFRDYADFTSSGPRSGDSAISPDVAAPGVSIRSTAVGTGSGSEVLSGTSMAAPHVAGVAALTVQAHPGWKASQISAAVVSTADPEGVAAVNPTRGGLGLVDAAQAVSTQVTATGDAFRTDSGWLRESALSFGFQESALGFAGVKTITVENKSNHSVTYSVSSAPSPQSAQAKVFLSRSSITVPAGRKGTIIVALGAAASTIGTSMSTTDQFAFYEFSGDVVLSSADSTLRVPYLLVPRSTSRVSASSTGAWFKPNATVKDQTKKVTLRNPLGALAGTADFYTWGLSDDRDVPKTLTDSGYDLRAAGVQSFDVPGDKLLAFAVNTHKRWSNAAANEFDVNLDTNGDGTTDWTVFAADSGQVRTQTADGVSEVFLFDHATGDTFAAGYLATAPTDSSTIILPVNASDLGLTAAAGTFSYSVESFGVVDGGSDSMPGSAVYNPWSPALSNGQFVEVPRNGSVNVDVAVNGAAFAAQKPLGVMSVVLDNASGSGEAILIKAK